MYQKYILLDLRAQQESDRINIKKHKSYITHGETGEPRRCRGLKGDTLPSKKQQTDSSFLDHSKRQWNNIFNMQRKNCLQSKCRKLSFLHRAKLMTF